MKVLVTGGAGFIGSNLVRELLNKRHDVSVLDNFHTGSMENIRDTHDRIAVHNALSGNINVLEAVGFEEIYHFGIPSSAPMYVADPSLVGKTLDEFRNILEYARKNGSKVVFASTSSLYNGLEPPHSEDMKIEPKDGYTKARFEMENMGKEYNEKYGVKVVGLRFFSVYGKNEHAKGNYANVVSQFLWDMQAGRRPVLYGNGEQTRDYVFAKDAVMAAMLAMESKVKHDVFNVGTGRRTNMNEVVEILNRALGKSVRPRYTKNPIKNYVYHTQAECSKAREVLGFGAEYGLESGIREILTVKPANA